MNSFVDRPARRHFLAAGTLLALWPRGLVAAAPLPPSLSNAAKRLDCTPDRFPPLAIAGDDISRYPDGRPAGFRGFADPCLRRDPASGDLWLAYSWPHMEKIGAGARDYAVGVETHLARSGDGGKSWRRTEVLWPKTPARFAARKTGRERDGFVSHEVPTLAHGELDGKPAWFAARLDYFLGRPGNYKDREATSFCIRVMAAPDLPALAKAPYATFGFDWSSPENAVDVNLTRLSGDFPVAFIPNEPALFYRDGRLYLAIVVMTFRGDTPVFDKSFIAMLATTPHGEPRNWKWGYLGKLAASAEARELGGETLTQVEIARARDGRLLALVTPLSWSAEAARELGGDSFRGMMHRGCAVLEVESLDPPRLAKRDGRLVVHAFLESTTHTRQGPGAATYDAASDTGILFTLRDLADPKSLAWSLHPTRLHPV